MKSFTLLTSLLFLFTCSDSFAGPLDPTSCPCTFEMALVDGVGLTDATDCQISEETSLFKERGQKGAFTETLAFVGGAGQACGTLMVEKYKRGNRNAFNCAIWIEESVSGDSADCERVAPGTGPVQDRQISRRSMRACQRLLDDVADEVFALPDCSAP